MWGWPPRFSWPSVVYQRILYAKWSNFCQNECDIILNYTNLKESYKENVKSRYNELKEKFDVGHIKRRFSRIGKRDHSKEN